MRRVSPPRCVISSPEPLGQHSSNPVDPDPLPVALFDLDGTLTDPKVGIVSCIQTGLSAVGVDADGHGDLSRFIGPPLQESFAELGVPSDRIADAVAAYRERFATHGMFENEVYPGVIEMLRRLRDAGWVLGVATSKPELFAVRILMHFELAEWFAAVAGATLDGERRTKADVVGHALTLVDRDPGGRVIMVGDRSHDIVGARAHGLNTIGVTWGYGMLDELMAADAWQLANTPGEVADLLL